MRLLQRIPTQCGIIWTIPAEERRSSFRSLARTPCRRPSLRAEADLGDEQLQLPDGVRSLGP